MDPKTIGHNVREYRRAKGWTQQELAGRAITCPGTIHNLERGRPTLTNTVRRVARALGVRQRQLQAPIYEGDRVDSVDRVQSAAG